MLLSNVAGPTRVANKFEVTLKFLITCLNRNLFIQHQYCYYLFNRNGEKSNFAQAVLILISHKFLLYEKRRPREKKVREMDFIRG